jgi:ankyrin repeat protein
MKKLYMFLFVIAAMVMLALFANTARAAMSDRDFIELCKSGSLEEIQAAIKNGADANAKDNAGWTALMMAVLSKAEPEVTS